MKKDWPRWGFPVRSLLLGLAREEGFLRLIALGLFQLDDVEMQCFQFAVQLVLICKTLEEDKDVVALAFRWTFVADRLLLELLNVER